jgi:hypothetical protein
MQKIAVVQVPRFTVIVANNRFDAELRKTLGSVDISFPHDVCHHDVAVGQQHQRRMMSSPIE